MWVGRCLSATIRSEKSPRKKKKPSARKSASAVRGADPRSVWRAEAAPPLRGPSTADRWLNWTKAEEDQFLITISANTGGSRRALARKTSRGAPRTASRRAAGEEGAEKKVRIALTWSRRRSNFFQYWNIDPTSAAILGDIEEIFLQRLQ